MVPLDRVFNFGTGAIILVLIILANFYQFKVRRRFSGVIGEVMFWYSMGLATLLVLTILEWIIFSVDVDLTLITFVERLFLIAAIACFLKGALVIR